MSNNGLGNNFLGARVLDYKKTLLRLDTLLSELEQFGLVSLIHREKLEKIIVEERPRIDALLRTFGLTEERIPSLDAVKATPGSPLPIARTKSK